MGNQQPWHSYGLEQEEYDHIFAVFLTFDTDGSGELDREELKTLCRWLNFASSDSDIDQMFRAMDTDGNGTLNMDEFCRWLSVHRPNPQLLYGLSPVSYNNVLFQFHTFDRNQDGTLDEDEFVGLAVRQGYSQSEQDARSLFRAVDSDHSGTVDLHELLTFRRNSMVQRAHANSYAQPPPAPPPPGGYGYAPQYAQPPQQPPQQYPNQGQQYPAPPAEYRYYSPQPQQPAASRYGSSYPPNQQPSASYGYPPQQQQQQPPPAGYSQQPPPPAPYQPPSQNQHQEPRNQDGQCCIA
jgi:Ca2+-binding EF-hand superfamily protein